ncbi:MAG: T9SS type A sorting domain-containing protein [Bacteroidota bacterium]
MQRTLCFLILIMCLASGLQAQNAPQVGPDDFRVSRMGPDGNVNFAAQQPAIAYNSTDDNYLAVWSGDEVDGGLADDEFEIYGQLINADGSLLGQRFRISFQGTDGNRDFDAVTPSVAYNSVENNFFVVWRGDDNQGSLVDDEFEIYGQLISNLGQLVGTSIRVSRMGTDGNADFSAANPDVAYNAAANNYLVVWHGSNVTVGQLEIHGQLMTANGIRADSSFQISNQGASGNNSFDAFGAAVTYNSQDNEYLVVWEGDSNVGQLVDNEGEIYGQLLSADGDEIGSDFRISEMGNDGDANRDAQRADVAYNAVDNNYLVVWFGDDLSNDNTQVHGQLIAANGIEIGQDDFSMSSLNPGNFNINPSVAYSSQQHKFLVTWTALPTIGNLNDMRTFGQYVDAEGFSLSLVPNGFFINAAPAPTAGAEVFASAVAHNSTDGNFLTVWLAEVTNGEFDILGQLISDLAMRNLGEQFRISFQGPNNNAFFRGSFSAVAHNTIDGNYLIVWRGDANRNGLVDGEFEIFGQLVSSQGFFIGQSFRISDMGPNGNATFDALEPSVVYNATENEYLVVWGGDDNSNGLIDDEFEIYGQLLNAKGVEIGTNDFRISDRGPNGNVDFDAIEPRVAYNAADNEYLVVWQGNDNRNDFIDFEAEIYGQRLNANGMEIGVNDFRISDMGPDGNTSFDARDPSVTYNGTTNEYLVVWEGEDDTNGVVDGESEIYGQRLDANGVEIGINDFRISDMGPNGNADFDAFDPSVTYNTVDNEYLVVWRGDDNTDGLIDDELEIFGQRLNANGVEIGTNDFRISDMGSNGNANFDAFDPSVTYSNVDNEYLIVWTGEDNSNGLVNEEFEIFGQRLNAAGIETGANDFRISEMGPDGDSEFAALNPVAIYNPTDKKYFVVWNGDDNSNGLVEGENEIYGELLQFESCPENLTDAELDDPIPSGLYEAINTITSSGTIASSNDVTFTAGESITLNAGFTATAGVTFTAMVATPSCFEVLQCNNDHEEQDTYFIPLDQETPRVVESTTLTAYPNPFYNETQIRFRLTEEQPISIYLFNQVGRLVQTVAPRQLRSKGEHVFLLRNKQGLHGTYFVVLQTEREQVTKKIVVTHN